MAFAAPVLVEGAAAGGSAAAASGAAEAGAGRAATAGATSAKSARTAPAAGRPTKTAAARADELVGSGSSRTKARRTLRHEYGATEEQADDLLDAAGGRVPPPSDDDKPAGEPSGSGSPAGAQRSGPSMPTLALGGAATAGGGLVLGALTYAVGLVFLRGGWAGVRAWLAAKFLNRVSAGAGATTAPTSPHTAPALPDGALRVMSRPGKPAVS
ncbi:MAG: hypothetical protein J0I40_06885 [Cellulomonas sp.]|uniref:hypothetical protein n=1 Tax=Cellulomonas sp. 73-92 TaxID=1895740 RepID=UPI000927962B|nr:hypothetical protein [Cellulomonas sp. 73-92]MBN9375104.1 hypothetical protein [Cellulomonas sp.]OJV76545.1 MAG: hypothetical protein BGO37_10880 [Cellulomonas sp. 73-92]